MKPQSFLKGVLATLVAILMVSSSLAHAVTAGNPHATSINSAYLPRLDTLVTSIADKGKNLPRANYAQYLSAVSSAVTDLGNDPQFSSNLEVKAIVNYISFELESTRNSITSGEAFMSRLSDVVASTAVNSTNTTSSSSAFGMVGSSTSTSGTASSGFGMVGSNSQTSTLGLNPYAFVTNASALASAPWMTDAGTRACWNKVTYLVIEGVDKTNAPMGCTKPEGSSGCRVAADFRAFTNNEWVSSSRVVSTVAANAFPNGKYETFVLISWNIKQLSNVTLDANTQYCDQASGSNNSTNTGSSSAFGMVGGPVFGGSATIITPKVYLSNSSGNDIQQGNINGFIYSDRTGYVIIDGVSATNPPKGCAKPLGSAGCSSAADGFREFTTAEGRGTTRLVSTIQANAFPVGDYEFFIANGSVVTKVGTGRIITRPSETSGGASSGFGMVGGSTGGAVFGGTATVTPTRSCSFQGFVFGAGTPGRACTTANIGEQDVNGAVCACSN
jgi:hypothetical protein